MTIMNANLTLGVPIQWFIEKNQPIEETPQQPCVSVDVSNNEKSNIDLEESIFGCLNIF